MAPATSCGGGLYPRHDRVAPAPRYEQRGWHERGRTHVYGLGCDLGLLHQLLEGHLTQVLNGLGSGNSCLQARIEPLIVPLGAEVGVVDHGANNAAAKTPQVSAGDLQEFHIE